MYIITTDTVIDIDKLAATMIKYSSERKVKADFSIISASKDAELEQLQLFLLVRATN